jgi:hypothetical protein
MADGDLLDAREAMSLLGINENELQTLVARGDLRAFRSSGTLKFRRDDIVTIRQEKGTEPTIIIPTGAQKKVSGVRPPSRIGAAVPPGQENATGEIVLDDLELASGEGMTQQVTAQNAAIGEAGGQTVMEPLAGQTGEMTVVEPGDTAIRRPAGSGSRQPAAPAMAASPAMSRVKAAAVTGVSMATSKRTQAVYQVKTAGPVWTALLIVTAIIFTLAVSVAIVPMTKGYYDSVTKERIIPPYLNQNVYERYYFSTPGDPKDAKPKYEFGGEGNPAIQKP